MNLVTGDWIPVVFNNGETKLIGLKELYEKAEKIIDLVLNPPQRISVMRLLICIAQAALDGPKDETEWLKCEKRIIPEALQYLEARINKFNLYDDKQPFLQIVDLKANKKTKLDVIDSVKASGNNPALFDHSAIPDGRTQTDSEKIQHLLTILNFSTGGKVGQAKWRNENNSDSTYASPCLGKAHTFIKGGFILKTIKYNLLTKQEINSFPNGIFGKPVWDRFPRTNNDIKAFENASQSYLGRLVPLSRCILLDKDASSTDCIFGPTGKKLTFEYLPGFREPSTTVILNKKNEPYNMRVSTEKHIWRELSSVLHLAKATEAGGAVALKKVHRLLSDDMSSIDIWVGGIANNKAKLLDMVEWNLSLPASMLNSLELAAYKKGIDNANDGSKALWKAVLEYCKAFEMENILSSKAKINYWQILDNSYQVLFDTVNNNASLDGEWRKKIYSVMNSAFRYACPSNTPRQIQAFAQAQGFLRIKKIENNNG